MGDPIETLYPGSPLPIGRGFLLGTSPYYLTGAEQIAVTAWGSLGSWLVITGRAWLEADRIIVPFSSTLRVVNFNAPATIALPTQAGALLSLRVALQSTLDHPPLIWVQAQVIQGQTGATLALATLLQGYVSTSAEAAYPGSMIEPSVSGRGVVGANAAFLSGGPGIEMAFVSQGTRMQVLAGLVTVTTSGVPANRFVWLEVLDANGILQYRTATTRAQVAGEVVTYSFAGGVPGTANVLDGQIYLPWPLDLDLFSGWRFRVVVDNVQAGDVVAPPTAVTRTWIDL